MRYIKLEVSESDLKIRAQKEKQPELANAICGDKEVLNLLLNSCVCENGKDNRLFTKLCGVVDALADPCWLTLEDEQWTWLNAKIDKIPYGRMYKDDRGNELPMYPAPFRRMIGTLQIKFDEATTTMPEELKEKVLKKEAAKKPKLKSVKTHGTQAKK